jgi:hypothetical protein
MCHPFGESDSGLSNLNDALVVQFNIRWILKMLTATADTIWQVLRNVPLLQDAQMRNLLISSYLSAEGSFQFAHENVSYNEMKAQLETLDSIRVATDVQELGFLRRVRSAALHRSEHAPADPRVPLADVDDPLAPSAPLASFLKSHPFVEASNSDLSEIVRCPSKFFDYLASMHMFASVSDVVRYASSI